MQINLPKTKTQQDFETMVKNLIEVLAEMNLTDVQKVLDFAVFIAD